jgi:hypothetical protein
MPLASRLAALRTSRWLKPLMRVVHIRRIRSTSRVEFRWFSCIRIFGISAGASRSNSHRQVLQFFPNQSQFANDLVGDLVFQDFTSLSRNTIAFTAGSSIVHVTSRGPVFYSSG